MLTKEFHVNKKSQYCFIAAVTLDIKPLHMQLGTCQPQTVFFLNEALVFPILRRYTLYAHTIKSIAQLSVLLKANTMRESERLDGRNETLRMSWQLLEFSAHFQRLFSFKRTKYGDNLLCLRLQSKSNRLCAFPWVLNFMACVGLFMCDKCDLYYFV